MRLDKQSRLFQVMVDGERFYVSVHTGYDGDASFFRITEVNLKDV